MVAFTHGWGYMFSCIHFLYNMRALTLKYCCILCVHMWLSIEDWRVSVHVFNHQWNRHWLYLTPKVDIYCDILDVMLNPHKRPKSDAHHDISFNGNRCNCYIRPNREAIPGAAAVVDFTFAPANSFHDGQWNWLHYSRCENSVYFLKNTPIFWIYFDAVWLDA